MIEKRGHDSDDSLAYSFYAMMDRMQYINRWGLMRNNRTENIKEHSMDVAIVAHALAIIRNRFFGEGRLPVDPQQVAVYALFHDATEIITGDLPTPIKYRRRFCHFYLKNCVQNIARYYARIFLSRARRMRWFS